MTVLDCGSTRTPDHNGHTHWIACACGLVFSGTGSQEATDRYRGHLATPTESHACSSRNEEKV